MLNDFMRDVECFLFVPISRDSAVEHLRSTVAEIVDDEVRYRFANIDELAKFSDISAVIDRLRSLGRNFVIWGAKTRTIPRRYREFMRDGKTVILFLYRPKNIVLVGSVVAYVESEKLAEHLWGRDKDGSTWSFVYFIVPITELRVNVDEVRNHVSKFLIGHTFVCRDQKPDKFEDLKQYLTSLMSTANSSPKFIRSYTRAKLVSFARIGTERFIGVLSRVVLSILESGSKVISKDWCLDTASHAINEVLGPTINARKSYAVPVCNDLRRLCVLSIDSDSDWGGDANAKLAPIGIILRDVYEDTVNAGADLSVEELRELLALLAILLFEYRDELGIACPRDAMITKLSVADEQGSSRGHSHADLIKYTRDKLLEIVSRCPDVIALLPFKLLNLIITPGRGGGS